MWHESVPEAELESAHQNYLTPQKGSGGLKGGAAVSGLAKAADTEIAQNLVKT